MADVDEDGHGGRPTTHGQEQNEGLGGRQAIAEIEPRGKHVAHSGARLTPESRRGRETGLHRPGS
jgi:hypothetical protein